MLGGPTRGPSDSSCPTTDNGLHQNTAIELSRETHTVVNCSGEGGGRGWETEEGVLGERTGPRSSPLQTSSPQTSPRGVPKG